jgi:hypothetical protein
MTGEVFLPQKVAHFITLKLKRHDDHQATNSLDLALPFFTAYI